MCLPLVRRVSACTRSFGGSPGAPSGWGGSRSCAGGSGVPIARTALAQWLAESRIYKMHPIADGGLCGHVPARPECITPPIQFLFIAPLFRIGLPSDPASRQRPCPSPCLRLCRPSHRTFIYEVTRHARRTRGGHRRCAALSRSVRWTAGLCDDTRCNNVLAIAPLLPLGIE